jgi:hypothetical protein
VHFSRPTTRTEKCANLENCTRSAENCAKYPDPTRGRSCLGGGASAPRLPLALPPGKPLPDGSCGPLEKEEEEEQKPGHPLRYSNRSLRVAVAGVQLTASLPWSVGCEPRIGGHCPGEEP